jgi:hypothetical protein
MIIFFEVSPRTKEQIEAIKSFFKRPNINRSIYDFFIIVVCIESKWPIMINKVY